MTTSITKWPANRFEVVKDSCQGRSWLLRLLFLIWLGYILARHVQDPDYESFLGGINLGIHELGHLVFMPLGEFMSVAGGSILQCLIPLISFLMFYRQKDFFAIAFSFVWLGSNLMGIARYMADARVLKLDLVSPFGGNGEVIHDWNYLLHHSNLLNMDQALAALLRTGATLLMAAGIGWGAWILWLIITSKPKELVEDWDTSDLDV